MDAQLDMFIRLIVAAFLLTEYAMPATAAMFVSLPIYFNLESPMRQAL